MAISKSKYTRAIQCEKLLWLKKHKPELEDLSVMNEAVLETGNQVGDLAMGYFGTFTEVPFNPEDFRGMVTRTQQLLDAGTPVICEATFSPWGYFCMVDILRVEPDGVHITEVKSSTHLSDIYLHDMAFQTWILRRCGLNVKSVSLLHLNSNYIRQGELDLQQLFSLEDCTKQVMDMLPEVEVNAPRFNALEASPEEPQIPFGCQCKKPYECGYQAYCMRDLPKPSVFELNGIRMDKALELQSQGILSFEDAISANAKLNKRQHAQALCHVRKLESMIDPQAVHDFIAELRFPLYFLDFETFQPAIPPYDGTWPYQQIPSQYSLHILREPGGQLEHREFLAPAGTDPRRAVAERLVQDIPGDGSSIAYYMSFEKTRISELAKAFPDLAPQLLAINDSMRDLLEPFKRGDYYLPAMGGSNSIKQVLPALFPGDPELDYHALEQVHNGSEAMDAYARLPLMSPEDAAFTRERLLRYCELDTLAMVRIYEKLTAI